MATGKLVPEVAKENGYGKSAFYRVISGESQSHVLRKLISEITKLSIDELWPDQPNGDS